MRPSTAVLLALLVVLSGCSQLAEPAEDPTATPTGPIEGTAPAANGTQSVAETPTPAAPSSPSQTRTATATATPAPTATATPTSAATRTATESATRPSPTRTARPTRTPARPPTATRTPTATTRPTTVPSTTTASATPSRTATPTSKPERLVLGTIDAEAERVTLRNAGGRELDLEGYVVDFDDGQRYTVPAYTLRPGGTVTIHTGRGDDAQTDLHAGFLYPVINDDGDTVLVETPNGRIVAARGVGRAGR